MFAAQSVQLPGAHIYHLKALHEYKKSFVVLFTLLKSTYKNMDLGPKPCILITGRPEQ